MKINFIPVVRYAIFALAICLGAPASAFAFGQSYTLAQVGAAQEVGKLPVVFNLVALDHYSLGQMINFKLFLKNVSNNSLNLEVLRVIPSFNVKVIDTAGNSVWNCEDNDKTVRLAMNETQTLDILQVWSFNCNWNQLDKLNTPISAGSYEARATMIVDEIEINSVSRILSIR